MDATAKVEEQYFDIPAAVLYLRSIGLAGASQRWLRSQIHKHRLLVIETGRKWQVSKSGLESLLTKSEQKWRGDE